MPRKMYGFSLDVEQTEKLRALATKLRRTFASVVDEAIEDFLKKHEEKESV